MVFRGDSVSARYKEVPENAYKHNLFIEALPPILNIDEIAEEIERQPSYDESERSLPSDIRRELVQTIDGFFLPLPKHIEIAHSFSSMIRKGYSSRNPIKAERVMQMRSAFRNLSWGVVDDREPLIRSTASGFAIVGCSGVGKSTAVESILGLYPQVITHTQYNDKPFDQMQLVWLKLDCPKDGSIKSLCLSFFQSIDKIIGTNYYQKFKRLSVDLLVIEMGNVASVLGLGCLIIDEINRLSEAKSGGAQVMINFFVELINTIGVPVVLVGTFKALDLLTREFATARRNTGQPDSIWTHMNKDEDWDFFIERLWEYQWTTIENSLTDKISNALYDETQGIIDIAVKLYKGVQLSVIGGTEKITVKLIRKVANDNLQFVKPMLNALRSKDPNNLREYSDLYIDGKKFLSEVTQRTTIYGSGNTLGNQQKAAEIKPDENVVKSPYIYITKGLMGVGVEEKIAKQCAKEALEVHAMDDNLLRAMNYAFQSALEQQSINNEESNEDNKKHSKKTKQKSLLSNEKMQNILDEDKAKSKSDNII
jgi:energy-coupling factor transporter ATP-binding protein EcfA2